MVLIFVGVGVNGRRVPGLKHGALELIHRCRRSRPISIRPDLRGPAGGKQAGGVPDIQTGRDLRNLRVIGPAPRKIIAVNADDDWINGEEHDDPGME